MSETGGTERRHDRSDRWSDEGDPRFAGTGVRGHLSGGRVDETIPASDPEALAKALGKELPEDVRQGGCVR